MIELNKHMEVLAVSIYLRTRKVVARHEVFSYYSTCIVCRLYMHKGC